MRVLPAVGTMTPRLAFEKSYSFFIAASFLGFGLPHRNEANAFTTAGPDHDHRRTEDVGA
jgi:hypothetical protein